jgi:hypothetical protein
VRSKEEGKRIIYLTHYISHPLFILPIIYITHSGPSKISNRCGTQVRRCTYKGYAYIPSFHHPIISSFNDPIIPPFVRECGALGLREDS